MKIKSNKPVNYTSIAVKGLLFYFHPVNAVITVDGLPHTYKNVWHGKGKLKTLMAFPSIFKGKHLKHKEMCEILTGHNIQVSFDRPCALQIDGETITGMQKYEAVSYSYEKCDQLVCS